jgi:allophanate hydrolase
LSETIASIVASHRSGARRPAETIARTYRRIRQYNDPAVFIHLRAESEALDEANRLAQKASTALPLFGVPIAVKDNIDVAGMPTTAACPVYTYEPSRDAIAVARLRHAGAIVIGKTNLDQFATGLVGVRSPYGIPRNACNAKLIPGGSSSGSAVAVAAGLVPMALGTDTAGSGRVPAALNSIVGIKPSLGLVPTAGVVPACRTLDCVSVFALTVDDAFATLSVMAGHADSDPFSRSRALSPLSPPRNALRIGVPEPGERIFFGDQQFSAAYSAAIGNLSKLGAVVVEVDMEALYETARLLYEGPWLAERFLTIRDLLASDPDALHPVTRDIIIQGSQPSAAEAFSAFYRLAELRRACEQLFRDIDILMLPTIPTAYECEQVLRNPVELNSRLGVYTNFVNLLDLCGVAIPSSITPNDIPFGVTLLAPAGEDALLASLGRAVHAATGLPLGATGTPAPPMTPLIRVEGNRVALAVAGAHQSGMPLNHELTSIGAELLEQTTTAADYRLFALLESKPPKPGVLRVGAGDGVPISVEVWSMSVEAFGRFVANVPAPMSIGTVKLVDGRSIKGFLVEPEAVKQAQDITNYKSWRAFVTAGSKG